MTSSIDPMSQAPAFPTGDCVLCKGQVPPAELRTARSREHGSACSQAALGHSPGSQGGRVRLSVPVLYQHRSQLRAHLCKVPQSGLSPQAPQRNPLKSQAVLFHPQHILQPGSRNRQSWAAPLCAAGTQGCRERQHSPAHPFSKAQQCPHHTQWLCIGARMLVPILCSLVTPHLSEVGSESWQEHKYLQGCAAQTPLLCLCCSPVYLSGSLHFKPALGKAALHLQFMPFLHVEGIFLPVCGTSLLGWEPILEH